MAFSLHSDSSLEWAVSVSLHPRIDSDRSLTKGDAPDPKNHWMSRNLNTEIKVVRVREIARSKHRLKIYLKD